MAESSCDPGGPTCLTRSAESPRLGWADSLAPGWAAFPHSGWAEASPNLRWTEAPGVLISVRPRLAYLSLDRAISRKPRYLYQFGSSPPQRTSFGSGLMGLRVSSPRTRQLLLRSTRTAQTRWARSSLTRSWPPHLGEAKVSFIDRIIAATVGSSTRPDHLHQLYFNRDLSNRVVPAATSSSTRFPR